MILTMMLLLTWLPQSGADEVSERAKADEKTPVAAVSAPAEAKEENAAAETRTESKLRMEDGAANEVAFLPGRTTPMPVKRGLEGGSGEAVNAAATPATPSASAPDPAALPGRLRQRRQYETVARKRIWYGLAAAGHGAAAFDGWSTRNALSQNIGHESNPFLRPFAHSGSLHLAIQASPALMDYLGHRMMTNKRAWVRRIWWVPQTAGTAASLFSGLHNMTLVP